MDGMKRLWAGLVDLWCGWTHGGGHIERAEKGFPTPGKDGKWLLAEVVEWEARK